MADCMSYTREEVSHSFENALLQVEHFNHSLMLSREKIMPDQDVINGELYLCESRPVGALCSFSMVLFNSAM